MNKFFLLLFVGIFAFTGTIVMAEEADQPQELVFFYSDSCPHCLAEKKFLNEIEEEYPDLKIKKYSVYDETNHKLMKDLLKEHNAEEYFGTVPLTFVGGQFFAGFDSADGIGEEIKLAIEGGGEKESSDSKKDKLPSFLGFNLTSAPLLLLSAVLGFLDGLNVCSLGVLIFILGLVLAFRSRRKIIAVGGTFIVVTAIVYGALIILWQQLFSLLSPYSRALEIFIGLIALGGGVYFFSQFISFRKHGVTCKQMEGKWASNFLERIKNIIGGETSIVLMILAILLFAGAVTIIEFPCSAALPVVFAGILADADLSLLGMLFYLSVFLLFYLLDELVIFLIAVAKLKLWLSSPKFTTWITLIEAIFLFGLGVFYLSLI